MSRQVIHDGNGSLQIRFTYDERLRELVKSLPDRRFNWTDKFWWVPDAAVVAVVNLLRKERFEFCEVTQRLYRERGGGIALGGSTSVAPVSAAPSTSPGAATDFTVQWLNVKVQAALRAEFPSSIWLVGEVSGWNKAAHKQIVGFHLVERDEQGKVIAKVNATLFDDERAAIEDRLAAAGDPFELTDEIQVRLRGRVDLKVEWGAYGFIVKDIDPAFTLGEAARRREEIRRKLTAEGLLDRNRSLPFPDLPLRVGLVTSLHSDAYNDVLRTLQESGFAFHVVAHGARVQGRQTEPSVLNALDWYRAHRDDFDVILICRGGGSRIDLAWFDSEPLSRAVALFPLPVVVGIGHERDVSALDDVGWRTKTPTAAAALLVDRVARSRDALEQRLLAILDESRRVLDDEAEAARQRAQRLAQATRSILDRGSASLVTQRRRTVQAARVVVRSVGADLSQKAALIPRAADRLLERNASRLRDAIRQLGQAARRDLASASSRTDEIAALLRPRASRQLALTAERLDARARRLHLLDPRRVVERGYAILRTDAGKVVTDPKHAPTGTRVTAELKRGSVRLRSEGTEE